MRRSTDDDLLLAALTTACAGVVLVRRSPILFPPNDEPDPDPDNNHGLPAGTPVAEALKKLFAEQAAKVLGTLTTIGAALPAAFPTLTSAEQLDPMKTVLTPLISGYWDASGQTTRARLGLDPDAWEVTDPNTKHKIETATLNFCKATNQTTSAQLDRALARLKKELIAGVVDAGDALPELTKRVRKVFDSASEHRAARIAQTETARAVHAASLESAKQSGVVAGKKWLLSANACQEICQPIGAKFPDGIPLDAEFDRRGDHPDYASVPHCPAHPYCRCSITYVLTEEYEKLLAEYGPPEPEGFEPGPLGPAPKEHKVAPPVEHKVAPDRLPKAEPRPSEPIAPGGDFVIPGPVPKPDFPADPAHLQFVRLLGGSTGAELVKDADGKLFVRKKGSSPDHLREEAHADAAYRALGVAVPKSQLYETAHGPVKLAEFHEGKTLGELKAGDPAAYKAAVKEVRKGFAADALLGNWDVVGTGMDNILVQPDGTVLRIDNGGALRYRAQGAKKGAGQWPGALAELDTLRDKTVNADSHAVFGALSDAAVRTQAKALLKQRAALLAALPDALGPDLTARLDQLKTFAEHKPAPAPAFKTFRSATACEAWGQKHYAAWGLSLSARENDAIGEYTLNGYKWMNPVLWTGDYSKLPRHIDRAAADAMVADLKSALARGKTPGPIITRRGVGSLADMGLTRAALGVGFQYTEKAFVSTSPVTPFRKAVQLTMRVPKGVAGGYVNVSPQSSVPDERELLLSPGTKYRIVEHKIVGTEDHLIVEVLP